MRLLLLRFVFPSAILQTPISESPPHLDEHINELDFLWEQEEEGVTRGVHAGCATDTVDVLG